MIKFLVFTALFIGAVIVPVLLGDLYWIDIFIFMLIFVILSTSLRLVFSTGQISFAHPGIAAIGGYCSGVMGIQFGLSFWAALPISCLAAALVSIIIGYLKTFLITRYTYYNDLGSPRFFCSN